MTTRRALLFPLAAVVLSLPASGCCFFTFTCATAGRRHEVPAADGEGARSPVLAAYTSPAHGGLAVNYRVRVSSVPGHPGPYWCAEQWGVPEERWLVITKAEILKAVERAGGGLPACGGPVAYRREGDRNVFTLANDFVAGRVSERCPWPAWELRAVAPRAGRQVAGAVPDPAGSAPADPDDGGGAGPSPLVLGLGRASGTKLHWVTDFPETEGPDVVIFELPWRSYRTPGGKVALVFLPAAVAADLVTWPVQLIVICAADN
jgi:hypothetical protein